ncbi:20536_t:CDS:2, partial [Dentiscutata erythropus]
MRSYDTLFLLILILFIKCIECYTPAGRRELASALISNKLYFYGGWNKPNSSGFGLIDIFYIDLSQPFDTSNPTFQLQGNLVPKAAYSAVVHENEIIIFGGGATVNFPGIINDLVIVNETNSFVSNITLTSTNNSNSNSWPSPRRWHTAVIDSIKANMYIWGGEDNNGNTLGDAMYKLDVLTYSWEVSTLATQPNGRKQHTATLIPDGKIIFIGGINNPDITQLDIYDTIADQWSQK